jgi:two-component system, LuxR family, response regulator FixJ
MTRPTVYVVDDDDAVRRSLELWLRSLDMEVRAFLSGEAFLAAYKPVVPSCLVVDLRMPEMDGLALQERLRSSGVSLPIIFLTGHATVRFAVQAMEAGAVDFLEKPYDPSVLLERVRQSLDWHARSAGDAARTAELVQRYRGLTLRQKEVLQRVVVGKPNKVIALELELSEKTIELHRAKMMRRMGADSLAELVKMWILLEGRPDIE